MMYMKKNIQGEQVRIIVFEDTRVAVLEHRGDPALIGNSVREFIDWRKEAGLPPWISTTFNIWISTTFNILYDNPDETAPENFRLDLCAATQEDIAPNGAGIVAKVIPGGRCAVLRHIGADECLSEAVFYLCADWLPQNGEEPRDFPLFCQRVSFPPNVPEHEAVTDIFLPLK
jgi:AraC family transcriptional regulator